MDTPLTAASAAASRTAQSIADFLGDVPSARDELGPVLCELFDVRSLLERLQGLRAIPDLLRAPVTRASRGCAEVLTRIDSVLSGCGHGPLRSGRWALTSAAAEVQALKRALEMSRRIVQLALETITLDGSRRPSAGSSPTLGYRHPGQDNDGIMAMVENLRMQVGLGHLPVPRLDILMTNCLDDIANYIESKPDNSTASSPSDQAPRFSNNMSGLNADTPGRTSEPGKYEPRIQSVTESLGMASISSTASRHAQTSSIDSLEARSISESSASSWLDTTKDEAPQGKGARHRQQKSSLGEFKPLPIHRVNSETDPIPRPSTGYSIFPPSSPPAKGLPPIPPPKSHRRQPTQSPTSSPTQPRGRAVSEANRDSEVSALGSGSDRNSGASATLAGRPLKAESSAHRPQVSISQSTSSGFTPPSIHLAPRQRLAQKDKPKDHSQAVYAVEASPNSAIVTSRHGKHTVRLWDLNTGTSQTSIKVPFYVQAQARSRDYFVRSHAVLSETLSLVAVAAGFGHTLEIWNWARRKKVQTISDAYRWAAVRADMYETGWCPLAVYREGGDAIDLYPVARGGGGGGGGKRPFGRPQTIELRLAGLRFVPRLPELAYSSTGPLLVAAAGPRPPRPNCPPAEHGPLLMAWKLDDNPSNSVAHRPYKKFLVAGGDGDCDGAGAAGLRDALPLCLATYGSVAVSIWIPASFRTVGRPGAWQVEPVAVARRFVLVWDFAANSASAFAIPDVLSCVSPDCRFVAYCDAGAGCLVVLDAMGGGELWRWPGGGGAEEEEEEGRRQAGREGFERLGDFGRVTELSFSADGALLFVGDVEGGVGVYRVKEGGGRAYV